VKLVSAVQCLDHVACLQLVQTNGAVVLVTLGLFVLEIVVFVDDLLDLVRRQLYLFVIIIHLLPSSIILLLVLLLLVMIRLLAGLLIVGALSPIVISGDCNVRVGQIGSEGVA
jgi:hypothetical protein